MFVAFVVPNLMLTLPGAALVAGGSRRWFYQMIPALFVSLMLVIFMTH